MTKNQSKLIIIRTGAANDYIGARPGAKRGWYRPCKLSVALAALFAAGASSQTQLATVSGTITDPTGAVVPGVSVTIVSQGTGLKRRALTDAGGEYCFAGLSIGNYSLRIERPGFQSQVREGVGLNSAAEVTINSQLAIGDLSQQTTVSANAAGIDGTTSTSAGLLPEQILRELPLDNRDLFSAVILEPGVAPNASSAPSLLSSGKSGQGELITANKGTTRENHGMVRVDHNFSSTHSLFATP
jgi:carboxypeptidase family protein